MWSRVHYIPIAGFLLLPFTFLCTYIIALIKGDVYPFVPYISDTANNQPEKSIFSQLVNLVAFLFAFTIYLRYKHLEQYSNDYFFAMLSERQFKKLNRRAFAFGLLSCLGLSIVANFQEDELINVHMTGAFSAFICSNIYMYIQTHISFSLSPSLNSRCMAYFRLLLSLTLTVTFALQATLGPYARSKFKGDTKHWKPGDEAYVLHLIATISEWVSALVLDLFMFTFVGEFQKITMSPPRVLFSVEGRAILPTNYFTDDHVEVGDSPINVSSVSNTTDKPSREARTFISSHSNTSVIG